MDTQPLIGRPVCTLVGVVLLFALAGCSTPVRLEGNFTVEGPLNVSEGSYVGRRTFERLDVGADAKRAIALFGEPDATTELADGSSVWRWSFKHYSIDPSLSPALLSLGGEDESADSEGDDENSPPRMMFLNTYVHVVDAEVVSKWQD